MSRARPPSSSPARGRDGVGCRGPGPLRRRLRGSGRRRMSRARPFVVPARAIAFDRRCTEVAPILPEASSRLRWYGWPHHRHPRDPPHDPKSKRFGPWPSARSSSITAGPRWLPAGYMGVDVFFVVSGFLITGLLMREAERRGSVSLRDFYMRRARRILPGRSGRAPRHLGDDAALRARSASGRPGSARSSRARSTTRTGSSRSTRRSRSAPISSRPRCSTSGRSRSRSSSTCSGRC